MTSRVYDYDIDPVQNNPAPPHGSPEGQTAPSINNVTRQLMANLADMTREFPWLDLTKAEAVAKTSATTFDITSSLSPVVDWRPWFSTDRVVRLVGASTVYMLITAQSFSTPVTTVTVTPITTGDVVPASLVEASVSVIDANSDVVILSAIAASVFDGRIPSDSLWRDSSFADNDLSNFENDDQGGTWSISSANPRSDLHHARYDASGQSASAYLYGNSNDRNDYNGHIQAHEGQYFYLSAQVEVSAAPGAPAVSLGMTFNKRDGTSLTELRTDNFTPDGTYSTQGGVVGPAPADTVYAVPFLKIISGTSVIYDFDDVLVAAYLPERTSIETGTATISTITPDWGKGERRMLRFTRGGISTDDLEYKDNSPSADSIERTTGSFIDDGFVDGETLTVWRGTNDADTYLIDTVTALVITLDSGAATTNAGPNDDSVITTPGAIVNEADNILLQGAFQAQHGDFLQLEYDGAKWREYGRTQRGAIPVELARAATVTLPAWNRARGPEHFVFTSGSVDVSQLTPHGNAGRMVILHKLRTSSFLLIDGNSIQINPATFPFNTNAHITLICDGVTWFEMSRHP